MDAYIVTTSDGEEHTIHASDILAALQGWRANYATAGAPVRYLIDDVTAVREAEK